MKQSYPKYINQEDECFILTKGEALVRGIFLKLCFKKRRHI